jgi:rubrerythrin
MEDEITRFYQTLAARDTFSQGQQTFHFFAQESQKHKKRVLRTYREIVSDALETSFSFTGIKTEDYSMDTELPPDITYEKALTKAEVIEAVSAKFCATAGQQSQSLLAGIPQAFQRMAKRKMERKQILHTLRE